MLPPRCPAGTTRRGSPQRLRRNQRHLKSCPSLHSHLLQFPLNSLRYLQVPPGSSRTKKWVSSSTSPTQGGRTHCRLQQGCGCWAFFCCRCSLSAASLPLSPNLRRNPLGLNPPSAPHRRRGRDRSRGLAQSSSFIQGGLEQILEETDPQTTNQSRLWDEKPQ